MTDGGEGREQAHWQHKVYSVDDGELTREEEAVSLEKDTSVRCKVLGPHEAISGTLVDFNVMDNLEKRKEGRGQSK